MPGVRGHCRTGCGHLYYPMAHAPRARSLASRAVGTDAWSRFCHVHAPAPAERSIRASRPMLGRSLSPARAPPFARARIPGFACAAEKRRRARGTSAPVLRSLALRHDDSGPGYIRGGVVRKAAIRMGAGDAARMEDQCIVLILLDSRADRADSHWLIGAACGRLECQSGGRSG